MILRVTCDMMTRVDYDDDDDDDDVDDDDEDDDDAQCSKKYPRFLGSLVFNICFR